MCSHRGRMVEAEAEPADLAVRLHLRADAPAVQRDHRRDPGTSGRSRRGDVHDRIQHDPQCVHVRDVHQAVDVVERSSVLSAGLFHRHCTQNLTVVEAEPGDVRQIAAPISVGGGEGAR